MRVLAPSCSPHKPPPRPHLVQIAAQLPRGLSFQVQTRSWAAPHNNQKEPVDALGCTFVIPVNEVASINDILAGGSGSSQPGFALYVFDNDLAAPATSTCYGGCATSWPPLLVTDGVASGVTDLGTIVRNDASEQATYDGRPLYLTTPVGEPRAVVGPALGAPADVRHADRELGDEPRGDAVDLPNAL